MLKYIVVISMIFTSQAFAKCADQADIVFYHEENDQHLHIGWYKPSCYVVTVVVGKDKGLQELRYGNQVLISSTLSEIHRMYFVHIYPDFKVYSWDDYQRIIYTKGKPCLELENDTTK